MKQPSCAYITSTILLLFITTTAAEASSPSFGDANNYFVHTLSSSAQSDWVSQVASSGAKVVRLWATGLAGGCVKSSAGNFVEDVEPSLGDYHDDSLNLIDGLLAQLSQHGIKAIISPYNANNLGGDSCDAYCDKWGSDGFYTQADAMEQYDARLTYILNFTSPSFGKPWSQLPEAILAFDVANEPFVFSSGLAADNDQADWLCGRAGHMASLIDGSGVKIATGGIAGSEYGGHNYNEMSRAIYCDAVDIVSVHGYMDSDAWAVYIPALLDKVNGKHLMVEEWGVGDKGSPTAIGNDQFEPIYQLFNDNGVPWLYWQVIPGQDDTQSCDGMDACCGVGFDHYEIGPGSGKGDIPTAMSEASNATAAQDWTGYVY